MPPNPISLVLCVPSSTTTSTSCSLLWTSVEALDGIQLEESLPQLRKQSRKGHLHDEGSSQHGKSRGMLAL